MREENMRRAMVVAAAAFLTFFVTAADSCSGGGGGSTSASATHSVAAVGQPMKNDAGQSVTVVSFKRNVTVTNQFEQPSPGDECVSVSLTLLNGASTPWSIPLYEMAVVDANGQSHTEAAVTCGGGTASISSLIPNGHANATLLFDVPKDSAITFTWTPSALNPNSNYQTALK
jgi:hypothetical protein